MLLLYIKADRKLIPHVASGYVLLYFVQAKEPHEDAVNVLELHWKVSKSPPQLKLEQYDIVPMPTEALVATTGSLYFMD